MSEPITRSDGTKMGPGAAGVGASATLQGTGEHWFTRAFYQGYSPKLDINDMGFLPQFDTHQAKAFVGYQNTRPNGVFRNHDEVIGGLANFAFDGTPMGAIARAPSSCTGERSSPLRTVAATRAPAARPSWIAAVPTPPAPP